MGKKNTEETPLEETTLEVKPEVKEVAPIVKEETTEMLSGYIQIKLIGTESTGIVVKAKQYGTTYPKTNGKLYRQKKSSISNFK